MPTISPDNDILIFSSSNSRTFPVTLEPFLFISTKSPKASEVSCFIPKEILSLSASIVNINASTTSPFESFLIDSSLSSQEISERWTNPSIPPSSSMNTPKSVMDFIAPEILSPSL